MGRKTQITKEQMLKAGLDIIIRDGFDAVSVKTIARELGCSTTPVAWTFESIDNYRKELRIYAISYAKKRMTDSATNLTSYRATVDAYIDMAFEQPNLIRFLRNDAEIMHSVMANSFIFDDEKNIVFREKWARELGISEEESISFVKHITIFTEGLVSIMLSDISQISKITAHCMLENIEKMYFSKLPETKEKKSDNNA